MSLPVIEIEHHRLCEIRILENENHRYGLFATADVTVGEEILCEMPIVACPTLSSNAANTHCNFCLRSLESPEEYVRRIREKGLYEAARGVPTENLEEIREALDDYTQFLRRLSREVPPANYPLIWCEARCQTVYCSRDCRKAAWKNFHGKICPGMDARRASKLVELRNSWRASQSLVPFKMFDIGLLLNILGSKTYTNFWRMVMLINEGKTAIPALAEADTREFVRQVFGPDSSHMLDLIHEYCQLKGISIISEVDANRGMTHEALLGIIHGILMTSMEVKGSALSSFIERYNLDSSQARQDFERRVGLRSLKEIREELETSELTDKEFNHSGFAIFRSMIYLRRSNVLQNADAFISPNKSLLRVTAIKEIKAGSEIIIGEVPQEIVTQWKATLEPANPDQAEDNLSADEIEVMEVEVDGSRNELRGESRGQGRKRAVAIVTLSPTAPQNNFGAEAASGSPAGVDPEEPPSRRARLHNDSIPPRYTEESIATLEGMYIAVKDIIKNDFYEIADYCVETDDLVLHFAQRLGIESGNVNKQMFGAALKNLFEVKNIKRNVYGENGQLTGRKHHYLGVLPKPGVHVEYSYLGP